MTQGQSGETSGNAVAKRSDARAKRSIASAEWRSEAKGAGEAKQRKVMSSGG